MFDNIRATSEIYWQAAIITALIDLLFVSIIILRIKEAKFRQLQPTLVIVSIIFWIALYTSGAWYFWDSCYGYVLPDWVKWIVPPFGLLVGILGYFFWWLALRMPWNPLLSFAILGGLHSFPGHLHGIYCRGLLEKCPILENVSAESALIFGFFEFIFYWCFVITISALVHSAYIYWFRRDRLLVG